MSRGEHNGTLPEVMVETDTGELILNNSYARFPATSVSGEQQKGASRLKAEGRNKPIEGMRSIV